MARKGRIYTYTIIHNAAEAFKEKTPYVVALIEENGKRTAARVEGYDGKQVILIGMEVELSRMESGHAVYKFIH